ncbi:hypothetical protein N7526_008554 [Penicillium atrosanguineum]|nr:hypothetical protein N7526_008554 [Penicillium atrosanguineum]
MQKQLLKLDKEGRTDFRRGLRSWVAACSDNSGFQRWLLESNGEVQGVITILLDMDKKDIVIRLWYMENENPVIKQEILLSSVGGRTRISQSSIDIFNAPFVVPFETFYMVPPTPGSSEKDIEVTESDLVEFAEIVWCLSSPWMSHRTV